MKTKHLLVFNNMVLPVMVTGIIRFKVLSVKTDYEPVCYNFANIMVT
jgi:hypothetical protein